ncbi:minor capsid protein [Clostridium sp. AM22-16AC]|nr:phage minor capsid protein [Clostridium sp. AM22-16AC]RHN99885.1 minor capsid protein [Clostridium sp. AM22-16AC]
MATKIRPPKKADVTALLRNLFLRTEQELIREITRKRAAGHVEYAEVAALDRVQKILQNMVDTSWSYVPVMIEKIFYHSDKDAAGYTNARTITGTRSVTQIAIMEQLANNLQGELMEMAGTAKRSVENVFTIARLENDPYRKLALEQILRQEAAGKPWIKSSQDLVKELETNGITGFTDKAGRKWSMQAYGNMAVRTTARQAEVAALLTSDEYDLWQITTVGTTCPVCAPLEGRVYSKSGTNPDYPPLTVAFGKIDPYGSNDLSNTYLNIHPNCLHSLVKYTTIGKSAEQIQKDKNFSSVEKNPLSRDPRTKKQIAAYREKEKNRQKLLRDMKQHKEYRAILGNDIPKDFAKFRELKYNNAEKWDKIHILYQDDKLKKKIRSPEVNKTIEEGKQGKHILGHKNYKDGRSYLKVSVEEAQRLVDQYAGTGQIKRDSKGHWTNKEFVSADHIIGVVVDANMGETIETSRFSIHYSKNGVHIVPRKE